MGCAACTVSYKLAQVRCCPPAPQPAQPAPRLSPCLLDSRARSPPLAAERQAAKPLSRCIHNRLHCARSYCLPALCSTSIPCLPHLPSAFPAQFIYFAGFVGTVIACWVLRDYGGSALDFSPLNEASRRAIATVGNHAGSRGTSSSTHRVWGLCHPFPPLHLYPCPRLPQCLSKTDPPNRSCLGQQAVMAIRCAR